MDLADAVVPAAMDLLVNVLAGDAEDLVAKDLADRPVVVAVVAPRVAHLVAAPVVLVVVVQKEVHPVEDGLVLTRNEC